MEIKTWFASVRLTIVSSANSSEFRTQRFKIAVLSSLTGKSVSIVSQLVALPLAIASLGIDRFGIYAMLVAVLNWMNLAGVAITPGLTVKIVSANSAGDHDLEARVFTTAFLFSLLVAASMFMGLQAVFQTIGFDILFGSAALPYRNEVAFGLQFLAVFTSLSIVLSIVEAAQAGYQNQHINNLLVTLGSLLSIIAVFVVVRQQPTIPNLILSIFGIPLIARALNVLHLFWHRCYLLPWRGRFSIDLLLKMITTGSAFLLTLFGTFLYQSFSIYWVGRELGSAAAAQMSVMMMVLNISGSILITVTQPLWPAIQDSVNRDDRAWVVSAYRRILHTLVPYIALAGLALVISGEYILGFWLKSDVHIDITMRLLWGVYFFIVAWEHLNYTVLIGMSRFWFASVTFSIGALVMVVSSVILVQRIGIDGMFISLCLGPLLLSSWLYPAEIHRLIFWRQ
jgi:O-antigen/teichoic acid export membrane protein